MSNFLDDGTILPFGLLSSAVHGVMDGFNKTYRNTALRVGVVIRTYPVSDPANRVKFATEYDVACIEQNEDKGATAIVYKHCIAMSSLGSIADFFEKTLRFREKKQYKGDAPRLNQQDGSCVLILCLDGSSDKAVIIGGFPHPDRPTTLDSDVSQLQGEYNGVNIAIASDGTATFTWKGPTNNDGSLVNPSQTPTVATIDNRGSFQINHKTITFRLDVDGTATLTSEGDLDVNCKNANVTASADANVTASGTTTVEAPHVKLGENAAESVIKGDTFKKFFDAHIHPTGIGPTGPPSQPTPANALSTKVKTE